MSPTINPATGRPYVLTDVTHALELVRRRFGIDLSEPYALLEHPGHLAAVLVVDETRHALRHLEYTSAVGHRSVSTLRVTVADVDCRHAFDAPGWTELRAVPELVAVLRDRYELIGRLVGHYLTTLPVCEHGVRRVEGCTPCDRMDLRVARLRLGAPYLNDAEKAWMRDVQGWHIPESWEEAREVAAQMTASGVPYDDES
ncbi:hypothetical protein [Micromonospora sp. WMMC273]|uniref:hypothetical protein n=1 Tax=Micromonospora sp. WMMC273 TaxID=3015157 RepID=UPI0022B7109A|nr:hypothetical protein [Micromonospora sp. WMMC273]MCZ7478867.1 hypothetical protein [Micromonospora sp. WMMC273]MCZ7478976.1 hypothetical protein [Micromonospora sp. WMMC273]